MAANTNSCPFPAETRAARCSGCIGEHGEATPCAVAWLRLRLVAVRGRHDAAGRTDLAA